jgi:O-antigen ligase/tetratricopeptide (TPR) repeat protein
LLAFGVALIGAKFALLPLAFDFSLDLPFVVSKAVMSHALAYGIAAVLAIHILRSGAFVRWSPLHIPVLAFLLVNTMATLFAENGTLALFGTHARMLGLATTTDVVLLYFAIALLVRTRSDAIALGASAFVASAFVLAYEAVQLAGRDPFPWAAVFVTRPFSTLGQPTVLAQYLTVLAVAAVALAAVASLPSFVRAMLFCWSFILLAGAVATESRSLLIGIAAGIGVFVLLVWLRHPSRRVRVFSFGAGALASVTIAAVLLFTPLGERFAATIQEPRIGEDTAVIDRVEPSLATRLALYEIGLKMISERPLLGYGPDNFTVGVTRYRPEQAPELIRQSTVSSPHSWFFHVATDSGLLGLFSFLSIVVVAFALALGRPFRALVVMAVAAMAAWLGTGATTVNEVGTEWLFWASAGVAAAATGVPINSLLARNQKGTTLHRTRSRSRTAAFGAISIVLVAVAIAASTKATQAARWDREAETGRLGGIVSLAVALGESATRADGGRAEYWHTLGLAYLATARWRDAVNALARAASLTPHDVRFVGDLARAQLVLWTTGDSAGRTAALELGDRVVAVDRNNPQAHLTRAVVRQATGDLPEAIRSVQRALALDPNSVNERLYITATQVLLDSGRPADAVQIAQQGLVILSRITQPYELRFELARALTAVGQLNEALAEVEKALGIRPNYPQAEQLRTALRSELAKRVTPPP